MWVNLLGTALFNDETPPHDALSVECLVDQVLVVREDFYLLTKEDVPAFLQGLDDTEELSLSRSVSSLSWVQLSTVEGHRLPILRDHCSQLAVASIRVDDERLTKIRAS